MKNKAIKRVRFTLSTYFANRMRKGDMIILETRDPNTKKTREFIVQVLEVTSDIPRCDGCTCRLDNKQSYKFKTGHYCWDCFQRKLEKHKETCNLK